MNRLDIFSSLLSQLYEYFIVDADVYIVNVNREGILHYLQKSNRCHLPMVNFNSLSITFKNGLHFKLGRLFTIDIPTIHFLTFSYSLFSNFCVYKLPKYLPMFYPMNRL